MSMDSEALITSKTKLLIISPSLRCVLNREEIARIAELAAGHDLIAQADEIYAEVLFEGEHVSIASFPGMAERTIILDEPKTYAMTAGVPVTARCRKTSRKL